MSPEPEKRSDKAEAVVERHCNAAEERARRRATAPITRIDTKHLRALLAALAASRADNERLRDAHDELLGTLDRVVDERIAFCDERNAARVEVSQLRAGVDRVMALAETMRTSPSPIANAYARDLRGALGRRGDCNNPRNDNENWRNCTRRNCCDPEAVVRSAAEPLGSTEDPPAKEGGAA